MSPSATTQTVWSGRDLANAFTFSARLLEHHRESINALNVFPVPDGDTGTNMALTMAGALNALEDIEPETGAANVADRLAYGALMGARGNSGVILSQFLRGFASGLANAQEIDGRDIARALDGARESAYKAVMRPVEGTMLTVIRAASESARTTSELRPSVIDVLEAALQGAQKALEETPQQLDILRQAGVVDAGGQGIVYILEALALSARGEAELPEPALLAETTLGASMPFLEMVEESHGEDAFGYCTNFMIFGSDIDVEARRAEIAAMGTSAVIVGDESMLRVHIHTPEPVQVLQYAMQLGELDQIKIDNMGRQTSTLSAQRKARSEHEDQPPEHGQPDEWLIHDRLAIIAVAAGDGISEALRSLGATSIVLGGQTMNPSTQDLLDAVESSAATEVILLPNHKNTIMAANQVDALTSKTVRVVPTRSIPAALAALTAFNTDDTLEDVIEAMMGAIAETLAISITRAVRPAEINGVNVTEGKIIGLINDELVTAGDHELDVLMATFSKADVAKPELMTIFVGENVAESDQQALAAALANAWPEAEVEMHLGGQPHYRYIISVE